MIAEPEVTTESPAASPVTETSDIAISVRNVSKMYRIYDRPQDRLKQMLLRGRRLYGREFWALRDVSLEVRRGETVGIIGRNGSGKSTLLQIIAGTLSPTDGEVRVNGRVAALLELGSGFNPEFTGRENVYMNGAILGLSREEMAARFDDIAAFADIGEFIDQPVKLYSSGMVVRLAFSINAHIDPDILIIDEALSVGDMYFQAKCMSWIDKLRRRGTTVLFVSHSLQTVKSLCDQALLLNKGEALSYGPVEAVADMYSALALYDLSTAPQALTQTLELDAADSGAVLAHSQLQPAFEQRVTERTGKGDAQFYECCVFQHNREVDTVLHGESCQIIAWLEHHTELDTYAEVGILVRNLDGLELFAVNSYFLNKPYEPQVAHTRTRIVFSFPVTLAPGTYTVTLGIRVPQQGEYWDKVFNAAVFRVVTKASEYVPGLFAQEGAIEYYTA